MVAVLGALLQQHQRTCLSPTRLSAGRPTLFDGEEEGDEEKESELEREEVGDKREGSVEGGEGLPPRAPQKRLHWPPKGSKTWSTGQRVRILTLGKYVEMSHYFCLPPYG